MAVVEFPHAEAKRHTARARLAQYLRELADTIDTDEAEIDPVAALIVLSGQEEHEVVCCGYRDDERGFEEAAIVAGLVARSLFTTLGGNRRKRGDYRPRTMAKPNIVDGVFPRKGGRTDG